LPIKLRKYLILSLSSSNIFAGLSLEGSLNTDKNTKRIRRIKTLLQSSRQSFEDENEVLKNQIKDFIIRINKSQVDGEEYIKDTALDFCRKQKLKEAMVKSIALLQQSSFDEISSVINDALKLVPAMKLVMSGLKTLKKGLRSELEILSQLVGLR
jgi:pyruvate-formate lyase